MSEEQAARELSDLANELCTVLDREGRTCVARGLSGAYLRPNE